VGGAGDDVLAGGAGKDKYFLQDLIGGDGIRLTHYDDVVEDVDGGIDTVVVTAIDNIEMFADGYTLTANVENGTVEGSLDFYLEGNELDNVLKGNAAANSLYGHGGDDTLIGGKGVDWFYFDVEESFGKDRITDFDAEKEVLVLSTNQFQTTKEGDDTVLVFGSGDRIILEGIQPAELSDANFQMLT